MPRCRKRLQFSHCPLAPGQSSRREVRHRRQTAAPHTIITLASAYAQSCQPCTSAKSCDTELATISFAWVDLAIPNLGCQ